MSKLPLVSSIDLSIDDLSCPVWIYDITRNQIHWANRAALRLWEADSPEELMSRDFSRGQSDAVRETLRDYQLKLSKGTTLDLWWEISPKGINKPIFCRFSGILINDNDVGMLVEARNSSLLQECHPEAQHAAMFAIFDIQGQLLSCNPPFTAQFGDQIKRCRQIFNSPIDLCALTSENSLYESDLELITLHGKRWHHAEVRSQYDEQNQKTHIISLNDIHERKLRELEHVREAFSDPLTGLLNRRGLQHHLSAYEGEPFSLYYIDLDGFKPVNDTYGHNAGDELLIRMATRLRQMAMEALCARLGGDEFLLVVPGHVEHHQCSDYATQLIERLSQPFEISGGIRVAVSASIGTARSPENGMKLHDLISCADAAMYLAKKQGRSRFIHYTIGMEKQLRLRTRIIQSMGKALEEDKLSLCYQPIQNMCSGKTEIVEALLRWHDDDIGDVYPLELIAATEETGKINLIEEWVIRKACSDFPALRQHFGDQLRLSINISGAHLSQYQFTEHLNQIVSDSPCRPQDIIIELTETVLLPVLEGDQNAICKIRNAGYGFAIDDFGTGYSSLAYISRIPATHVKIDKAFVDRLSEDEHTVECIHTLCQKLGMQTIAEGVEQEHQKHCLTRQGICLQQGFLHARPVPLAKLLNSRT